MGFWSSVGSFIGSAISTVSNALGSIGSSLGKLATSALNLGGWLGPVAKIAFEIARALGVFQEEDNPEELGAKAMQSDKKPEDFDSTEEYIDYLRNEIELDKEKFEKAGPAEKAARVAVGTGIAMKGINEVKGFDIPVEAWASMAKIGLDETKIKEIDTLLNVFKNGRLEDFAKYVDGKLNIQKEKEIGDALVEAYSELEPNASKEQIEQKVMQMQVGDKEPPKL